MKRPTTQRRRVALAIAVSGGTPPDEFRIFTAGVVDTTKGKFTFDDVAAKSVMAEYEAHGIDLMIDYDHASLASISLDPAESGKAAGWFKLELRNGELWATSVRWAPPAAEALSQSEWRFISPAFSTDDEGRITSVLNVAITNLPATRQLQPLMAASITTLGENAMTLEEFMKVCKALGLDMTMSLDDAMAKIKGEPTADPAEPDADDAPSADPAVAAGAAPAPANEPRDKNQKPEDVAASVSRFMRLSGKTDILAALAEAEVWRTSHLTLETERQVLASERLVLEAAERRKGCVELVTLAGRKPATVWANDAATEPKSYLSSMPLKDFRVMVADAIKANGKQSTPRDGIQPGAEIVAANGLTASELAACKRSGCTPEAFLALKSQRDTVTA